MANYRFLYGEPDVMSADELKAALVCLEEPAEYCTDYDDLREKEQYMKDLMAELERRHTLP
jgi:hypothetical protein